MESSVGFGARLKGPNIGFALITIVFTTMPAAMRRFRLCGRRGRGRRGRLEALHHDDGGILARDRLKEDRRLALAEFPPGHRNRTHGDDLAVEELQLWKPEGRAGQLLRITGIVIWRR